MNRTPLRRKTPLKAKKQLRSKTGLKRTSMKRKGRSKPTAEQQRRHDAIRALGCIICGRPAAIHHIREDLGMGQKVNHDRVLGICFDHHQSEEAGAISIHGTPILFQETYGTEYELEQKTIARLGYSQKL
jgi:hypothetical protein